MSEIPADIRAAAAAVVDRGYDTGLIDAVAAALMAERERCWRVAHEAVKGKGETFTVNGLRLKGHDGAEIFVSAQCVEAGLAAIRTPSTGEEQ